MILARCSVARVLWLAIAVLVLFLRSIRTVGNAAEIMVPYKPSDWQAY